MKYFALVIVALVYLFGCVPFLYKVVLGIEVMNGFFGPLSAGIMSLFIFSLIGLLIWAAFKAIKGFKKSPEPKKDVKKSLTMEEMLKIRKDLHDTFMEILNRPMGSFKK